MILVDTNVVSTLVRINALQLLWELFDRESLAITPAILREISDALAHGCNWLTELPRLIQNDHLKLVAPNSSEVLAAESLPASLGLGEREAIALCAAHGWAFITNDTRARNYCREVGVEVFDLAGVLRALWLTRVRSKQVVRDLIDRIEQTEGLVFKNKEAIFQREPK